MSLYEQRLAADRDTIRGRIVELGMRVEGAVADAVRGLLEGDRALCARTVLGDLPINRESRAIDKACHAFVARHLPSAGHLRFVSSVMRLNVSLERIGDYAVTIGRVAAQLSEPPPERIAADMRRLSTQPRQMLRAALRAFDESDAELARNTKPLAEAVERAYEAFLQDLVGCQERSVGDLFALLTVFNKLERVSDQAKNICEETLFAVTGETKPPKIYRVLFADARDSVLAPLATALARRAFPESGRYEHAGWAPANALAPELRALADRLDLDLAGLQPRRLDGDRGALTGIHVVVGLQPGARERLDLPFHSVLLEWSPPSVAEDLAPVARHLSHEIRELMVTLCGGEAG